MPNQTDAAIPGKPSSASAGTSGGLRFALRSGAIGPPRLRLEIGILASKKTGGQNRYREPERFPSRRSLKQEPSDGPRALGTRCRVFANILLGFGAI